MPTATKVRRETWLDPAWVPPERLDVALADAEPLMTRDELVDEMRDISARDLVYWQSAGVLPYPIKRWHRTAVRALYPQWIISLIHTLKNLQTEGYKLREIGPLLRDHTYFLFMPPASERLKRAEDRLEANKEFFTLMERLTPDVWDLARVYERLHGERVVGAQITLIQANGRTMTYPFLVREAAENETQDG